MKKFILFLTIGLLLSGVLFAQTTQGANTSRSQGSQTNSDYFAGGGYTGPVLGVSTIESLMSTAPNTFVIVEGFLVQQRVPGTFVLADAKTNYNSSVVIRLNPYFWSNLEINADTPVLVYGVVNRSELRIEIEATRIEIK